MLVMTAEAGAREIASLKRQVDHWWTVLSTGTDSEDEASLVHCPPYIPEYNDSLTINDMPSALPTNLYDVGG